MTSGRDALRGTGASRNRRNSQRRVRSSTGSRAFGTPNSQGESCSFVIALVVLKVLAVVGVVWVVYRRSR